MLAIFCSFRRHFCSFFLRRIRVRFRGRIGLAHETLAKKQPDLKIRTEEKTIQYAPQFWKNWTLRKNCCSLRLCEVQAQLSHFARNAHFTNFIWHASTLSHSLLALCFLAFALLSAAKEKSKISNDTAKPDTAPHLTEPFDTFADLDFVPILGFHHHLLRPYTLHQVIHERSS